MKRQENQIKKVISILAIICGVLFILAALLPWINYTISGISVSGVNISDAEKHSSNLFQYGIDGRDSVILAGALMVVSGVVLLSYGLFCYLEKHLMDLVFIAMTASVIGFIGAGLAITNSDINDEYKAMKIASDLIIPGVSFGRLFAILAGICALAVSTCCICSFVYSKKRGR